MNDETRKVIVNIVAGILIAIGVVMAMRYYEKSAIETPVVPTTIEDPDPAESTNEADEQDAILPVAKRLYKGYWFDIEYPENFTVSPTEPINYHEGVRMVLTDQAYFKSPDGKVEFYVYSPLWAGYPEYLDRLSNEIPVDEDIQTGKNNRVTYTTVRDNDGAYTRSFVLHENDLFDETASTTHVFGIKYVDQASYDLYLDDYRDFKASLQQYAD